MKQQLQKIKNTVQVLQQKCAHFTVTGNRNISLFVSYNLSHFGYLFHRSQQSF